MRGEIRFRCTTDEHNCLTPFTAKCYSPAIEVVVASTELRRAQFVPGRTMVPTRKESALGVLLFMNLM